MSFFWFLFFVFKQETRPSVITESHIQRNRHQKLSTAATMRRHWKYVAKSLTFNFYKYENKNNDNNNNARKKGKNSRPCWLLLWLKNKKKKLLTYMWTSKPVCTVDIRYHIYVYVCVRLYCNVFAPKMTFGLILRLFLVFFQQLLLHKARTDAADWLYKCTCRVLICVAKLGCIDARCQIGCRHSIRLQ